MARFACFYFQVHQPFRIRAFNPFDPLGGYFDEAVNRRVLCRVAERCYLPANLLLTRLRDRYGERFNVAFSITGTALDQLRMYAPEALESFQSLCAQGGAELLAETYHHSLAFLFSPMEFREQVRLHVKAVERIFGQAPKVMRNTELIYSNDVAREAAALGFQAVLAEGASSILGARSPNRVYRAQVAPTLRVLTRNYRLSDDIAFRFTSPPLTARAFAHRLRETQGDCVNLFMDYETFGEHHLHSTGIFEFVEEMCSAFIDEGGCAFLSPSQLLARLTSIDKLDVPQPTSWADEARDLSAWLGNEMQHEAARTLYALEGCSDDTEFLEKWRMLQTSDHLYYLSTKGACDGEVHHYFSPHVTPYDAYASYMNILWDLRRGSR